MAASFAAKLVGSLLMLTLAASFSADAEWLEEPADLKVKGENRRLLPEYLLVQSIGPSDGISGLFTVAKGSESMLSQIDQMEPPSEMFKKLESDFPKPNVTSRVSRPINASLSFCLSLPNS